MSTSKLAGLLFDENGEIFLGDEFALRLAGDRKEHRADRIEFDRKAFDPKRDRDEMEASGLPTPMHQALELAGAPRRIQPSCASPWAAESALATVHASARVRASAH